jgi:hypothetical protein
VQKLLRKIEASLWKSYSRRYGENRGQGWGVRKSGEAILETLSSEQEPRPWSLSGLREKLIKIGAQVVSQVAVSRQWFAKILSLIARLRAPPAPV